MNKKPDTIICDPIGEPYVLTDCYRDKAGQPAHRFDPATQQENVLMAFVMVDDKVCIVRADEVERALVALHGAPTQGLKVTARIEYALRSASDVAEMEAFDRLGLDH